MARQRLTENTPCSPAARRSLRYANNENNENTPPRVPRDSNPQNGEHATPRGNGHQKQGASPAKSDNTSQSKESPGGGHKRSNSVDIRKMQNLFKTAAEDNIKSIRSYVTELKERVAKLQYQKQLLVCQVWVHCESRRSFYFHTSRLSSRLVFIPVECSERRE